MRRIQVKTQPLIRLRRIIRKPAKPTNLKMIIAALSAAATRAIYLTILILIPEAMVAAARIWAAKSKRLIAWIRKVAAI